MDDHCAQPVLIRYLEGTLPPGEAEEVFGHLAFCDACRLRVEALREIRRDPDGAMAAPQMAAGEVVAEAGAASAARHPGRLKSGRGFRVAVRVIVDRARGVAAIAAEGLEGFVSAPGLYRQIPLPEVVGAGDRVRLAAVSPSGPRVEMRVEGPGIGGATVVADARRNAVSILLYPPAGAIAASLRDAARPRAVLLDADGRVHHEVPFEVVAGAPYLLAEFERLEKTDWILGLDFDT